MLDGRTLEKIPDHWLHEAEYWRDTPFVWKRWARPHDLWAHDHCRFCWACICDHRDRDQYDKPGLLEGGHYRYAFICRAFRQHLHLGLSNMLQTSSGALRLDSASAEKINWLTGSVMRESEPRNAANPIPRFRSSCRVTTASRQRAEHSLHWLRFSPMKLDPLSPLPAHTLQIHRGKTRQYWMDNSRVPAGISSRPHNTYFPRAAHRFHVSPFSSSLINTPPTTERAWNPRCVPSVVQYQSVSGTRLEDSLANA